MNFYQLPIVQKLYTKKASVFTLRHNVEIDLEPQPSVVAALVWSVSGSASSIPLGRLLCWLEQGRRQGSVSERFGACSEGMFFVFRFIRRPRLPLLLLSLLSSPSLMRMPARSTPLRSAWSCWMKWTFHSYVQVELFSSCRRDWTTPLPRLWRMFSSTSIWARVSLQRIFSLRYIFFFFYHFFLGQEASWERQRLVLGHCQRPHGSQSQGSYLCIIFPCECESVGSQVQEWFSAFRWCCHPWQVHARQAGPPLSVVLGEWALEEGMNAQCSVMC